MTDFRRCFHALLVAAFLASLAVPAYADFTCSDFTAVNVSARAEGFTELGGDIVFTCSGGTPTVPGLVIPTTNITVTANTNITSRILATIVGGVTTTFNEALLIIDQPNTNVYNHVGGRPLSNCGYNGEDSSPAAGPGVCAIIAPTDPSRTYDGSVGVQNNGAGNDFAVCATAGTYGCGRPNVFQGRQGGALNKIQFVGVPFDPPGSVSTRNIRITNIRVDGTRFGMPNPFSVTPVTATISFSGSASISVPDTTVTIAQVQQGMTSKVFGFAGFLQSVGTDQVAGNSASSPFYSGSGLRASPTGGMDIRIEETFPSSWKVRNLQQILDNGTFVGGTDYAWRGTAAWSAADTNQNVPGSIYFTESGFENSGVNASDPVPNPPNGFGALATDVGRVFRNLGTDTGISAAGKASQGTHISVQIANIPSGIRLFFPINVVLQNTSTGAVTGVMQADALADQNGFNSFTSGFPAAFLAASPTAFAFTASGGGPTGAVTNTTWVEVTSASPVITYEVLFEDPIAREYADIIPAVVYNNNGLASNLPQPGVLTTATVSFAPIQSGMPNPDQPQMDGLYATPRFASSFQSPADTLFSINACATPATNSTASVKVARGGFRFDYAHHRYTQQVTVTNTSATAIAGLISLVIDGLSGNANLVGGGTFGIGVNGLTVCDLPGGSPFVYWGGGFNLDPGATASFGLQFSNPTNQGITYTTRVLSGLGTR